jgi:hypothetical protein
LQAWETQLHLTTNKVDRRRTDAGNFWQLRIIIIRPEHTSLKLRKAAEFAGNGDSRIPEEQSGDRSDPPFKFPSWNSNCHSGSLLGVIFGAHRVDQNGDSHCARSLLECELIISFKSVARTLLDFLLLLSYNLNNATDVIPFTR